MIADVSATTDMVAGYYFLGGAYLIGIAMGLLAVLIRVLTRRWRKSKGS